MAGPGFWGKVTLPRQVLQTPVSKDQCTECLKCTLVLVLVAHEVGPGGVWIVVIGVHALRFLFRCLLFLPLTGNFHSRISTSSGI
jgi:hypothetical protein